MFDGVARDHRPRASAPDEIKRAGREDRVHHRRIDRSHPAFTQGAHGRGDSRAAARDVVYHDDTCATRKLRKAHVHAAIAQAPFHPDHPSHARRASHRPYPWL
jgi:hypothetical protein